jgi:hypothetical protein
MKKLTIKFSSISNMRLFIRQLKTGNYDMLFHSKEVIGIFSSAEMEYAIVRLNETVILEDTKDISPGKADTLKICKLEDHRMAPVNALGYLRVMFAVKDLDELLARLYKL